MDSHDEVEEMNIEINDDEMGSHDEVEEMNIEINDDEGGGGGGGGGEERGLMYLVWEDVKVMVGRFGDGPTRMLLNGLSGYAEPGRFMAIMGPSASGKSTLLDALAGRLARNIVMTGNVLLNGKKMRLNYSAIAYVTQQNNFLGTLTVRETLRYSANLRLPSTFTKEEINDVVEGTITKMGLEDCSDRVIGNWHLRGISGGEKKRLSIALEILTKPHLLFLDEPTSGLDSAAAFFIVQTLKIIGREGRTVVSSIHQPSSEIFALFDDLFLLSGGETVYFGPTKTATSFFAEAGFPCPNRRNPSDHFLRCVNSDFDKNMSLNEIQNAVDPLANIPTAKIKAILVKKYKCSRYAAMATVKMRQISLIEGVVIRSNGSETKWWKQLSTLTQRSFKNMSRDFGYYWIRIGVYIVVSICVGTIFFDIGTSYKQVLARGACGSFIAGFMTFMSIGGFQSFIEEMKVYHAERLNDHYGVSVYILSNFLSSFPFLTVMSVATASITYYMVKFHQGIPHYVYICLDLISSVAVVESCMMIIASMVPNFLMGITVGAGYIGLMMMTAGQFRFYIDLPKIFWRYPVYYVNYGAWALQGAYKNDMIGLEFDSIEPGGPKLKGEEILTSILGIQLHHSKWWDLAVVVLILIAYKIIFFFVLKFKDRSLVLFQTFHAKTTLRKLKNHHSFRKMSSFRSNRHHQALHALSSQEGLNSPIH